MTTHHIRQFLLHIDLLGTEADGLALQSQITDICYDRLLPALERVLDRYVPPDVYFVLDRLVIEVGTLELARFEDLAAEAVAGATEKVVREQAAQLRSASFSDAGNAQIKTGSQTVEEAFFYFLNSGHLPWAFRLPKGRSLEQVVLSAWSESAGPTAIPGRVREPLRRALALSMVRQRLVWQFSAAFRDQLLAAFWPESHQLLKVISTLLRGDDLANDTSALAFEGQLWEGILVHLASGETATAAEMVSQAWCRMPALEQQPVLAALLERRWLGSTQVTKPSRPTREAADNAVRSQPERGDNSESTGPELSLLNAEEGFYLDNAGLVLLHPFLPQFFEGLGVAAHDQLLQPGRALALLHFLATGQPLAPEHELILPKLLCAVPQAQSVAADMALTIAETDEAEALLQAVIRHWSALRSTSSDGLRGTFLARPGKLSLRPDGDWLLQVEPMSYDILLNQLPWGISMVQLPWMPHLLRVEWG